MSRALQPIAQCDILKTHRDLAFQKAKYRYRITFTGDRATYQVTDGTQTIQAPLEWAFGLGQAGQTYVFRRNGIFYESRVSFYREIQGLDLTMGAAGSEPGNIEEAAGRAMGPQEARRCFGCHATNTLRGTELDVADLHPGVQCQRCHAGAERHANALQQGEAAHANPAKLSRLSTEETSNFCGQCHRTWGEIAAGGPRGVANIRFQPYRLSNSKCYDVEDARIRCTACHDPHRALETSQAFYDAKCQACHTVRPTAGVKPAAAPKRCPVATSGCAGCHMPKTEIPGSHNLFTDHEIRVVRHNEVYPN